MVMITKARELFERIKGTLLINKTLALQLAHTEIIERSRQNLVRSAMKGMLNANAQKNRDLTEPERLWWKSQTAKWETIWGMINEACACLNKVSQLPNLRRISDAAFTLYEQMSVDSVVMLREVPSSDLKKEALHWREIGVLTISLYRHCLMGKIHEANEGAKSAEIRG